jgi:hypothetical protein
MPQKIALNQTQSKAHEELLLNLLDIRGKLMLVDPRSLTLDRHIEWNNQVFQIGLAIIAMERAILTSISEDYAKELPRIEKATERLERDLHKLKEANDVIAAVGTSLGTIASIAGLLV